MHTDLVEYLEDIISQIYEGLYNAKRSVTIKE